MDFQHVEYSYKAINEEKAMAYIVSTRTQTEGLNRHLEKKWPNFRCCCSSGWGFAGTNGLAERKSLIDVRVN